MQYLWMSVFALLILGADQFTKHLVVENIALHQQVEAIPGLVHWTYAQNKGAAFSILSGQQWLFVLVFAVFAGLMVWEFSKKRLPFTDLERWCFVAVFAGGLGNLIDRVRLGYVVDMIEVEFISFPVFNVADCFITCGCILAVFSLLFLNKQMWKDGKK